MDKEDLFAGEAIGKRLIDNLLFFKTFAIKLTGDADCVDDLLQETLVKVLCNVDSFVYNTNFNGWVTTIMHNIFFTERTRAACCMAVDDGAFFDSEYHDEYIDTRDIIGAIKMLPSEYCEAFLMYVDGYKYNEIAYALNIPLGTVKSRIHTARTKLQTLLRDYWG
jgi:RNA polymerase sigma-70 factor (ECF subfamily)